MAFLIYDIIFLIVFAIFIGAFLYVGRKNIKKEGLLLLYKASWGIKLIDYVGEKYRRSLNFLSYISIGLGYVLMAGIIYLFGKIVYIYVVMPSVVQAIKIPPIMPLIPYIDKVVPSLGLPPFYFTYWIVILAIIAIPHEFFHGIFMRRYGVKIKSTGFGFFPFFLPVFLAAFVEQDEKSFEKSSNFKQMAILSAGTFANVLTAIFFFLIMMIFFSLCFVPAGAQFNTYSYSVVPIESIIVMNGIVVDHPSYENVVEILEGDYEVLNVNYKDYFGVKDFSKDGKYVALYDDAPAINADLKGAITEINGIEVKSWESLGIELSKYRIGDEVLIKTTEKDYAIILGEYPDNPERAWLGIGFNDVSRQGFLGKIYGWLSSFKEPNVYYEAKYDGLSDFVYNLLWWLILISISVALVNMLPVGIFDGGRFFYLTVLGLTKSESAAKKSFKFVTWFFLFLLAVLMAFWFISFF